MIQVIERQTVNARRPGEQRGFLLSSHDAAGPRSVSGVFELRMSKFRDDDGDTLQWLNYQGLFLDRTYALGYLACLYKEHAAEVVEPSEYWLG
jgi:hypothetical protein